MLSLSNTPFTLTPTLSLLGRGSPEMSSLKIEKLSLDELSIVPKDEKNGNIATTSCIGNLPGHLGDFSHPCFFSGPCALVASERDVATLVLPVF